MQYSKVIGEKITVQLNGDILFLKSLNSENPFDITIHPPWYLIEDNIEITSDIDCPHHEEDYCEEKHLEWTERIKIIESFPISSFESSMIELKIKFGKSFMIHLPFEEFNKGNFIANV